MRLDMLTEGLTVTNDEEILPLLMPAAKEFLLAGGCLFLGDWNRLSEPSRQAFLDAADEIREDEKVLDAESAAAMFGTGAK